MSSHFREEIIGNQRLVLADCLEYLPGLEAGSVECCIADPPYGCGKASWDEHFPTAWYAECRRVCRIVVIITGSAGLSDSIPLVGNDFKGCIAAWNVNSLTRGSLGFANWLAAVVACGKPRQGQDVLKFAVTGDMPEHPCPKPIEYILRLVERVTESSETILDPFLGSGTTLVAAELLGRRGIGIEIEPKYFDLACRRVEAATKQPRLPGTDEPGKFADPQQALAFGEDH